MLNKAWSGFLVSFLLRPGQPEHEKTSSGEEAMLDGNWVIRSGLVWPSVIVFVSDLSVLPSQGRRCGLFQVLSCSAPNTFFFFLFFESGI